MSRSDTSAHRVPPYKRPIIIIGFLLILAVVIIVTVLIFKNLKPNDNNSAHLPSQDNSSSVNNQSPSDDNPTPDEPENKTPQYEGEDPNLADELSGVITYRDIDPENQVLHSAVTINQYLQDDGQCVYNLRIGDAIYRTASAIATPDITTSVCGPFAIPIGDLDPGIYQIEVIITGDGKRGVITDEIQI